MKRSLKYFIYCGIASLFIVNISTMKLTSFNGSNLSNLIIANAQSECPEDERDVHETCVKPCPGGGSAGGEMTFCKTGNIDCTPKDCDAKCGVEV